VYDIPRVGDVIYVDSDLHVWHGVDDFHGGRATVTAVRGEGSASSGVVVEIAQNPGTVYTWAFLAPRQAELAAKFGDEWAHASPDFRPEFNEDTWE
jgi:hypothetical protein